MIDDGPVLAERIAQLTLRIEELVATVNRFIQDAEDTYARKDVMDMQRQLDATMLKGLEDEVHSIGKRLVAHEGNAESTEQRIINALEAHKQEHQARSWQVRMAVFGAGLSLIVAAAVGLLTLAAR